MRPNHEKWPLLFVVVAHLMVIFISEPVASSSSMKRLYEDLFADYNRLILPVANNKSKVVVTVGLKLGQILDLNLKQQILSTNVWVEQTWHDYKLQWDPSRYEGIDMVHVPAENIWIPDIVLFNNADGNYELTLVAKARLYSNGTVVWKPPTMFRSTCEIDVEYFPFDIQTCFLRFGSWTYAGDELELRHVTNKRKADIGIDLSQFYKNVEWDIIDVPAYYNEVYYECCPEPFPDITFKIVIRRKMLFYLVNLILPVALMTFMTVSVFYLPSDSNEKVTLSISILTSLIVFFLLMLEIIPASSLAVPLFGKYLLFTLVLVSLSACVSVYVLNIHHRSPAVHSMSPRMRRIFLETLPRLLNLDRPDPQERSSLNRFRKKKIAQQMLNQSFNKVYDVAQPLAASLNLIETLHKSYHFDPNDDGPLKADDEEGRYFRRYVDNYIARLKKVRSSEETTAQSKPADNSCGCEAFKARSCCEHNKCCSRANQPTMTTTTSCCGPAGKMEWTESSVDPRRQLVSTETMRRNIPSGSGNWQRGSQASSSCACMQAPHHHQLGMLNDDTLDMTFDYDGQDQQEQPIRCNFLNSAGRFDGAGGVPQQQQQSNVDDLPSPPPPPRQLTQLSDSLANKSGRLSGCSKSFVANNSRINSSVDNDEDVDDDWSSDGPELVDHGQLVNKLISSINLINNSEEIDVTTTTSTTNTATSSQNGHEQAGRFTLNQSTAEKRPVNVTDNQQQFADNRQLQQKHQQALHQQCSCNKNNMGNKLYNCASSATTSSQQQQQQCERQFSNQQQPSELLMSLRYAYDQMPAHVRAAIRSILFIADTIKNEDDENSAIEDWESMSMVVDRLFLWIFFILCTFGSLIILALAPSLYDQRASIDDKLRIDIPPSNCSASAYTH